MKTRCPQISQITPAEVAGASGLQGISKRRRRVRFYLVGVICDVTGNVEGIEGKRDGKDVRTFRRLHRYGSGSASVGYKRGFQGGFQGQTRFTRLHTICVICEICG